MSYGQFLATFLVVPIVILALILRHRLSRRYLLAIAAMVLVAFVYTTPWDNLIISMGVWSYDPERISGILLGWVPLEEYLFFVLQTILAGLLLLLLLPRREGS